MPASSGAAFTSPTRVIPNATIDLTEDTKKRAPQECLTEQSNPTKRRRGKGKKPVIVDLDDAKEDVELIKNAGHWRDHWMIQLISIRGEMQNIFSAPPKQGSSFLLLVFFLDGFDWFLVLILLEISKLLRFFCDPALHHNLKKIGACKLLEFQHSSVNP